MKRERERKEDREREREREGGEGGESIPDIGVESVVLVGPGSGVIDSLPIGLQPCTCKNATLQH